MIPSGKGCVLGMRRRLLTSADGWHLLLWQHEAHDDLAVAVELAGRHEPEPCVEPGRPAVLRYVAREQLRRALGPHQRSAEVG